MVRARHSCLRRRAATKLGACFVEKRIAFPSVEVIRWATSLKTPSALRVSSLAAVARRPFVHATPPKH